MLGRPVGLDGKQVQLSVSIGIAFGYSAVGADELCRSAVAAQREAEASGTNCYRVFEANMRSRAQRRLELTGDLRAGLDEEQFRSNINRMLPCRRGSFKGLKRSCDGLTRRTA